MIYIVSTLINYKLDITHNTNSAPVYSCSLPFLAYQLYLANKIIKLLQKEPELRGTANQSHQS